MCRTHFSLIMVIQLPWRARNLPILSQRTRMVASRVCPSSSLPMLTLCAPKVAKAVITTQILTQTTLTTSRLPKMLVPRPSLLLQHQANRINSRIKGVFSPKLRAMLHKHFLTKRNLLVNQEPTARLSQTLAQKLINISRKRAMLQPKLMDNRT